MKDDIDYFDEWFWDNEVMTKQDYDNLLKRMDEERK